jgi:chromosome segregation and condensation protein ScpB
MIDTARLSFVIYERRAQSWIICRRKRVGGNGCTGSRQRSSPPASRSLAKRSPASSAKSCSIDLLIDDIREELRSRPYDLVAVAGGWKHLTRPAYADAIRSAFGTAVGDSGRAVDLTQSDVLVLMCIGYFQPITRAELSSFFGKEISRDLIGHLRGAKLIARAHAARRRARPTPTSPQKNLCWSSGSTLYATCQI